MSTPNNNQPFPATWTYIPHGIDMSRPPPPIPLPVPSFVAINPPPQPPPSTTQIPFQFSFSMPPPPIIGQLTYPHHLMNAMFHNAQNINPPFSSPPTLPASTSTANSKEKQPHQKCLVINGEMNNEDKPAPVYSSQRRHSPSKRDERRNSRDQRENNSSHQVHRLHTLPRKRPWKSKQRNNLPNSSHFSNRYTDEAWEASRSREPLPKRAKLKSSDEIKQEDSVPASYRNNRSDETFSDKIDSRSNSSLSDRDRDLNKVKVKAERFALNESSLKYSDFDAGGESTVSETEEEDAVLGEIEAKTYWVQNTLAKVYYSRDKNESGNLRSSSILEQIQNNFETKVLKRSQEIRCEQPKLEPLPLPPVVHHCHHHHHHNHNDLNESSSSSSSDEDDDDDAEVERIRRMKEDGESTCSSDSESENQRFKTALNELRRKEEHPTRLHRDLWFNESNYMNDGPLCRCSWKAKQTGIAHSIYPGEKFIEPCDPNSNNLNKLFHYRLGVSPLKNFSSKTPSIIKFDDHDYTFQGFSVFTHYALPEKLPVCRVVRWNIEYTLTLIKEEPPENFVVRDLELVWKYFFVELLEMYDVDILPSLSFELKPETTSCPIFHVMPRFVRPVENDGIELLSMNNVLKYLSENYAPLFPDDISSSIDKWPMEKWDKFAERLKGQLVTNPNKRPTTIRVDQIDRQASEPSSSSKPSNPVLVHFGIRPAVLTYTGNPEYQRAWKQYVKFRHLLMMKPKLTAEDRLKLSQKETNLQRLKAKASLKRDVTVEVPSDGFYRTGLYPDVVQHGLMMLVMFCHLRLHWAFAIFEERIKYKFTNHALLELAFTHPSYRSNYGTNPDHARNTLSNCGIRQPEYGNKRNQQIYTRKRGINTLIDIMSRMGSKKVKQSQVANNERLEYLGDAVIEFLSTIHLYFMFPDLQEGGLATYRSSLVQNKHLAVLAKKLGLDEYMLYAHGPDLCHEADLKHAMANAFEAVMGALFLDGGVDVVDRVYGNALFLPDEEPDLNHVWFHLKKHPLQEQEPNGDRHWVKEVEVLKKLVEFESQTGIVFKHIRLLARAFTRKNVGYNFLTLGHNQRLEFLGDTVLQLVTSEFLYKHFPEHHEGHLSLLRSCLVKNKTQSVICDDLGMTNFVVHPPAFLKTGPPELRMKDKADLVEAFLGALYVDRGLEFCKAFCRVCLYPRLRYFIMSQKWNDPKSQLQQCCLTIRNPDGGEPDIPVYKVICVEGPTNTRIYKVAVYFRAKRLATGSGHSVQEAEMKAAEEALDKCASLFPHLQKQKHFIQRRFRNEYNSSDYVDERPPKKNHSRQNNRNRDASFEQRRRWRPKKFSNYNGRNFSDKDSASKS